MFFACVFSIFAVLPESLCAPLSKSVRITFFANYYNLQDTYTGIYRLNGVCVLLISNLTNNKKHVDNPHELTQKMPNLELQKHTQPQHPQKLTKKLRAQNLIKTRALIPHSARGSFGAVCLSAVRPCTHMHNEICI